MALHFCKSTKCDVVTTSCVAHYVARLTNRYQTTDSRHVFACVISCSALRGAGEKESPHTQDEITLAPMR